MDLGFQAAALVFEPFCANAIAWSEENLVAVASGHLVTILNPAKLPEARGLIKVPTSEPFQIGLIDKEDLLSGCLLPYCVSRDMHHCVKSISWSPIGFAPNASCLLAVCTNEGCVKIYRMPFFEFRVEWVEVMDISEMIYTCLKNANFEVSNIFSSVSDTTYDPDDPTFGDDVPISRLKKAPKRKNSKALTVVNNKTNTANGKSLDLVPVHNAKRSKGAAENFGPPLITPEEYASRNAMISSLTVSWSPYLPDDSTTGCTVLAVGAKSGGIYFWRFRKPQHYSTQSSTDTDSASLVGFLQAHKSWVTAITWTLLGSDVSNPQIMLFSGSSDGDVKIWLGCNRELQDSFNATHASFTLLKEVTTIDYSPVSVLSVIAPLDSSSRSCLAIGKGSGAIDVWICDTPEATFEIVGSYHGHDHIVTGLAWAFDGRCLYSCSQDNSLCSWILMKKSLNRVSLPSNTPGVKSFADVPNVFDSCLGLAVSPGNMVLAVVHGYDAELLNPMYEKRSNKAAVKFLWIGGQCLDTNSDTLCEVESFPDFCDEELIFWEKNLLWSLNQHKQHLDKVVVVWDITAALMAFNKPIPKYVERVLLKWLESIFGSQCGISNIVSENLGRVSSRTLQLLNIITRQVVLKKLEADKEQHEKEQFRLWTMLLSNVEKELRERLVGFGLSVVSSLLSDSDENRRRRSGFWVPVGLAQMLKWVDLNRADTKKQLKQLADEVGRIDKRELQSICEYVAEEECNFCSSSVPLDSPEFTFCRGGGTGPSHKLVRCAVSMRVCPTTPLWHCLCCKRSISQLAPSALFAMPEYPSDFESFFTYDKPEIPLCPFCGILLQRLQPDFLLSPSPV